MRHSEALQYLTSLDANNFDTLSPVTLYALLSEADGGEVQKYVHLLEEAHTLYSVKHLVEGGVTVEYDFMKLITPGLLANPSTPTSLMQKICDTINFNHYNSEQAGQAYYNLSANPNTPEKVLQQFCHKQERLYWNPQLLKALTMNPSVPLAFLMDERFLKKVFTNTVRVAMNLTEKPGFTTAHAKQIIYGDYHPDFITAIAGTEYATAEDKIYVALRFG